MYYTLARFILAETSIDTKGFTVSIDNYSILHTLQRHGNPAKEAKHGQIAVTKLDFVRLPMILYSPDSVRLEIKQHGSGISRETLVFTKELEHCYFVFKEMRRVTKKGKDNRLMLKTLYIRKKT